MTKDNALLIVTDSGGTFTRTFMTKNETKTSFKDENVIKINKDQINMNFNGGADVNITDKGITSTYKDGVVDMNDAEISCTYSGHFMKVSSGGVALG
jgi:hypothetical protein